MQQFFTKSDNPGHQTSLPPHGGGLCCLDTFNQRNTWGGMGHVWELLARVLWQDTCRIRQIAHPMFVGAQIWERWD
jgi:hypothetical protein